MAQEDGVGRIERQVHEVGREQRDGEGEDLAAGHRDAAPRHRRQDAAVGQGPPQHEAVEEEAGEAAEDVARRQELGAILARDEQSDDQQPETGAQDVLAEEDRSRAGEHREHPAQQVVGSLDRGQDDEDDQEGPGAWIRDGRADQHILEADDDQDDREAERQDRSGDQRQRPQQAGVVTVLVVHREEPADTPVEAERDQRLPEGHQRQGVGERAVVRLRQVADDQELDREVQAERDEPAHQQQARSADLTLGDGRGRRRAGLDGIRRHVIDGGGPPSSWQRPRRRKVRAVLGRRRPPATVPRSGGARGHRGSPS